MQKWNEILLALGYSPCTYVQTHCARDGDFRLSLADDPGSAYPCPKCSRPSSCAVIAHGYTRSALPQVEHALLAGLRTSPKLFYPERRRRARARKAAAMAARARMIGKLTPDAIVALGARELCSRPLLDDNHVAAVRE